MPRSLARKATRSRRTEPRRLLLNGLHLAALWAAAFAQPLFDLLSRNAAFFAIRASPAIDIVVFALATVVLVPVVLLLVEALVGLVDRRLLTGVHLLFVGGLVALLLVQVLDGVLDGSSGYVLIAMALALGAAAALAYSRLQALRLFLTVVSPAPLLFLLVFLVFSPVSKLVLPSSDDAAAGSGAGTQASVVMVVFDQLPTTSLLGPDGRVDAERYPNFARLAKRSDWFRNAAATSDLTEHAVPAILTGKRPGPSDLPTLSDHPNNVFTLFGGSHRMAVTESITHLCPKELCRTERPGFATRMRSLADDLGVVAQHMVLPVDLRGGLPSLAGRWEGFGEEEEEPMEGADPAPLERLAAAERSFAQRRERFLRFASSVGRGAGNRPSFHFLHSMLPHYDWEYLPSGRNYPRASFMPGLEGELRFTKDRARVERIYQRHLLQVEFVDRLLGRLLRRLRATGRYDQTLIVVTADHGATFRPGLPLLGWSGRDPADILPVPLFIKAPGQRRGREVDAHIQTVDILPTVAGLLDLDIPWKVDGRSALARSADRSGGLLHHPGRQPRRFSSRVFDESYRNALRHKMSLFGPGKGIYAVGPRQSLLGRRLRDLSLAAPTRLRAEVHRPESYGAVDMRSTFVPAHVSGRLTGRQAGASRDLLIAVNGRIAAAARAARVLGSDESHFSAIVPEKFFRQGANRVQVLAVSATGELTPLASIRPRQVDYSLGGGEIRVSNGASIKIADGALEGFVDSSKDEGDAVAFGGWALPRRGRSPADRILAFGGGRLVYAGAPKLERMDVAKAKRTTARGLGFRFSLPKETATRGVRVFAVEGRRASELRFYCKDRARQVTGC